ncbi:MAG: hypothetical protein U1D30_08015 [Planctomycetota bacterium]
MTSFAYSGGPNDADRSAVTLDAGTYRLVVSGSNTSMASYSFKLLDVTTPDHFNLSLNSESSGNIDRLGSLDEWTFVAVQGHACL